MKMKLAYYDFIVDQTIEYYDPEGIINTFLGKLGKLIIPTSS